MDKLARLRIYFHTADPLHTIDVLPITAIHGPQRDVPHSTIPQPDTIRTPILACTATSFHPVPPLANLECVVLTQQTPLPAIQEGLDTNARGFDPTAAATTVAEAEAFRMGLVTNCAFTARLNEQPVAAGMFTPPLQGIAEVVGITTLSAYRRRGIGAALTSEIVRIAFNYGVDIAVLRTDNPEAYRMYTRIGFAPVACLLTRPEVRGETS
jgi:ribosomal protein S18 acetylase RimI-like enzyme